MDWIRRALKDLAARDLIRNPPTLDAIDPGVWDGRTISVDGKTYVAFGSNDYLGLAGDRRLREAACRAASQYGAGSGASRLMTGTLRIHRELEERLAAFKGTEDAVLFSSGYQAGIGAVCALACKGDAVVMDKLSHACLIDGTRASQARVRVYPHLDVKRMSELLSRESGSPRRLVVSDSLFSMDGDLAPLEAILSHAQDASAMVLLDEAHATGTIGPGGRGLAAEIGAAYEGLVQMGTLSKALGSVGGFLAGTREVCEYLRNVTRSYIYTTAPAPAAAGAALEALRIIQDEGAVVDRLRAVVERFAAALPSLRVRTPIVPVVVGEARRALEAQSQLKDLGIWAPAVRPPTVANGQSRLRISLSAAHTDADIDRLAEALTRLALGNQSLPGES